MNIKKLKTKLTKNFYILEIIDNYNTFDTNASKHILKSKSLYKEYMYFKKFDDNTEKYCTLTNKISKAKKFKSLNDAEMFLLKYKMSNRFKPILIEA